MSELDMEFNLDDLPPPSSGSFDPLPEGWYIASIVSAEVKTTKAGTGKFIAVRMDVMGPTHQGRVLFTNLNINNPNPKAEEIGRQQLGSIMSAIGLAKLKNTDQLIGGKLQVKVAIKHEPPRDPENECKGYKAVSGSTMPSAMPKSEAAAPAVPAKATPPWGKKS